MDRLFLDANVLFTAAHRPQGKAAYLLRMAVGPEPPWQVCSSAYAVEEARRNLAVKSPPSVAALTALLEHVRLVPQPSSSPAPLELPPKDAPIWAAVQAARASHLLTGDLRDFGPHMNRPRKTAGITIQTVAEHLQKVAMSRTGLSLAAPRPW